MEFKPFPKIDRLVNSVMSVTQKIHGTNAQVFVFQTENGLDLLVGSRTRWITPESDNYGFAAHVYAHKQEFIDKLGVGQHFGEWAGPGINSGEGLTEKTFVLFDHWKFPPERPLPPKTVVVPVLYDAGVVDLSVLTRLGDELKASGSRLVPGFMRPEGMVVMFKGTRFKIVFDAEETQWQKGDGTKEKIEAISNGLNVGPLLQPIRLEKLLSRDEIYLVQYPESLPDICSAYIKDLIDEGQIKAESENELKAIKKALGSKLFAFVKAHIKI